MSTMTLEQVRDWHATCAVTYERSGESALADQHRNLAAAITAHLAQPAQAVDVGAAAKRLGAHLFHEHTLLLPYPALCKALDISLAESPKDAFVKELLRVNDQRTSALSGEKAGPVGDGWMDSAPIESGWYWRWDGESYHMHFVFSRPGHAYLCVEGEPYGPAQKRNFEAVQKLRGKWMRVPLPTLPASPTPGKEGQS